MNELVADCPRCGASKITFDVEGAHFIFLKHDWKTWYEVFGVCRRCSRSTTFKLSLRGAGRTDPLGRKDVIVPGALNAYYELEGHVSLKDSRHEQPPEHLPPDIAAVFNEGATCLAVDCFNAAGTMFRLCVDMATRAVLPAAPQGPADANTRRNLGARIRWLLDNGRLPETLRELSGCIREDGNDGAHAGTLEKAGAEDLLDFTTLLLERLYTEPARLQIAQQRRTARRQPPAPTTN